MGKVAVMGLLSRHGRDGHSVVRTTVVKNRRKATLQHEVRENVEPGSFVYSDELLLYHGLDGEYVHTSSTTPRPTCAATCTRTAWRTSGRS